MPAAKKAVKKKTAPSKKSSSPKVVIKEQPPIRIIVEIIVKTQGSGSFTNRFLSQPTDSFRFDEPEDISPYEFVIKIKKLDGLIVSRIDIQNATLFNEDLKDDPTDPTMQTGKASSIVPGSSFLLTIMASGDAFTATTFTMTCDGKKVFDEDQEIKITSSGNGGYRNLAVPLP